MAGFVQSVHWASAIARFAIGCMPFSKRPPAGGHRIKAEAIAKLVCDRLAFTIISSSGNARQSGELVGRPCLSTCSMGIVSNALIIRDLGSCCVVDPACHRQMVKVRSLDNAVRAFRSSLRNGLGLRATNLRAVRVCGWKARQELVPATPMPRTVTIETKMIFPRQGKVRQLLRYKTKRPSESIIGAYATRRRRRISQRTFKILAYARGESAVRILSHHTDPILLAVDRDL